MTRKFFLKCFVYLFLYLTMGVGSAYALDVSATGATSKDSKEEVILIQSAASGIIEKDKTQKDQFIITLQKVMPYVSYVADRPSRTVGKISLERYMELWLPRGGQNSFKNNPPNAIIHANAPANSSGAHPQYFALEISEPKYDSKTETIIYRAKPLIGEGSNIPDAASFNHITLIIDGVCIGCWD